MSRPGSSSASVSSRGAVFFGAAALAFTLMAAACSNLEVAAPPVAALGASGGQASILEAGRRIYVDRCARCHTAQAVRDYPPARWPAIIAEMGARTKLSPEENRQVLAYALAASR